MARARARVSVGGFMVLVLLVGAGLGWTVRKARMQREAVAAVEKAGGFVTYDFGLDASRTRIPRRPRFIGWLDRCIGRDYIYSVVEVVFLGNLCPTLHSKRLDGFLASRPSVMPEPVLR